VSVLPDVLEPNLRVVFCGTAVGETSARVGEYYAGPGNQFWPVLARVGLTPRQLAPSEFRELPKCGIGLTDLAKNVSGADEHVAESDFDVESFRHAIENAAPRALAFNGKRAAGVFFDKPTREVSYGRQPEDIGETAIFVLPSTSGSARGYWDESHWSDLAEFVRSKPKR
jgi:TDG/mug DNA glycosylase family protein